jgi:NAD-dependent dihydropyrimidine dehydrogenase PreA subunit
MASTYFSFNIPNQFSPKTIREWRFAQLVFWLIGVFILTCLLFYPSLGITLFWNILIPVAPALFVIGLGIWRNVCPLATTVLLPRHYGMSKKRILSPKESGMLNIMAVLLLFIIVPLRHALFNSSGKATGLLIISMALTGMVLSLFFEWKSAWCSGLCPVHPVEKLYGGNTSASFPNAHCHQCMNCVKPCPDSTPNIHPESSHKTRYHTLSGQLITGGLPGFIWGWFHVPDEKNSASVHTLMSVYFWPLLGLFCTLLLYMALKSLCRQDQKRLLVGTFAAAGVSCYYWFRIPALFGFGYEGNDGLLVNLRNIIPAWVITLSTVVTTTFFFYWLVIRNPNKKSWVIRPTFAKSLALKNEKNASIHLN